MSSSCFDPWRLLGAVQAGALVAIATAATAQANLPPPPVSPHPVQRYEYDANGNATLAARVVGGADAGVVLSTYDGLGRLTTRRDGAGGLVRLTRNPRGDVAEVIDPLALSTRYRQNGFGQPIQEISPDAGTGGRAFDSAGRLSSSVDARGVTSTFTYDALGRLRQTNRGGAGFTHQTFEWSYDETDAGTSFGIGRLTTSRYPHGVTRHAYDALGRPTRETRSLTLTDLPVAVVPVVGTTSFGWDNASRLTTLVYPSGRTLRYIVANGRVSAMTITSADGQSTTTLMDQVQWDPTGEARSWRWGLAGNAIHETVRDVHGRVQRQRIGPYVRDITYDTRDRVASYTHRLASTGAPVASLDQAFVYDDADRLKNWTTAGTTYGVGYDANGNRTTFSTNNYTEWLGRFSGTNRLSVAPNPLRTMQYDAAGNLASTSNFLTLLYDASGRLATSQRSLVSGYYFYDANGRRVAKFTWVPTNPASPSSWRLTQHFYDLAGRLVAEHTSGSHVSTAWTEYYWLGELPVAVHKQSSQPDTYYVHTDHLGAPRALVDSAGALRWTWLSDPFGYEGPNSSPTGLPWIELNLRLPGQYFDSETGFSYNWHRYYDAGAGRYTQSDPIGLAGGINTYAYVDGNPLSYTDPLGLKTFMCTKPLHGLGDTWGPRMYPESRWNPSPAYHQFLCVKDASGKVTCGGQDRTGSAFVPGSPGKPSDDSWPTDGNGICKPEDDRDCVDQCVIKAVKDPKRPWYAVGPFGTDCQEWSDEILKQCQKQCSAKKGM